MENNTMFTEIEDPKPTVINNKEVFADMVHQWGKGPVEGGVLIDMRSTLPGNTELRTPLVNIPSALFWIFEGCKVRGSVACSDLFKWAAETPTLPTPPPELAEDFDAHFSTTEFYNWLVEIYESDGSREPRYFQAASYPTLPAAGLIFFRHTDVFFQLVIPQAVKMEHRQIRLLLLKGEDDFDRISCTDLLGNVEIFQFPINGEEALAELCKLIQDTITEESLTTIYNDFESELGLDAEEIFRDAMENHHMDISWADVLDSLGEDADEVLSEHISALMYGRQPQVNRRKFNSDTLLETATKFFDVELNEIVEAALDNCSAIEILEIADKLKLEISQIKRAAIEKL